MQVLTPSGYRSPVDLANGDEVCAFDAESGAPIINHVENIDAVDYADWCRWWQVEAAVPAFIWIRVNGSYLLFGEQSIWRNGENVCHAKHLAVGDEIYDDADQSVAITSVEVIEDNSLIWYRFDIDGDHSYIVDGLTVHNASRFWVGGTGTWDSSTTTHWAASSNGAGGQSVPGSADTAAFDGNSGGGTVTFGFGGTITVNSIIMGAFTGTLDNSANNNDVSLGTFNGTGSAVRTLKLGNSTWTLTGSSWNISTTTNMTFDGGSSIITCAGATSLTFSGGNLTYPNVILPANSNARTWTFNGSHTIGNFTIGSGNFVVFSAASNNTISTFAVVGSSSDPVMLKSSIDGAAAGISVASGSPAISWAAIRSLTFSGGASFIATNSFDLDNNSGITITPPGGGSPGVIGS